MSTKVLIDMIPTAQASRCSSMFKAKHFIQETLKDRNDVFFYWLVPEKMDEKDREWLPQHPNIRYFSFPYMVSDRIRSYHEIPTQLSAALAFNGKLWDFDVFLTTRTAMIPAVVCNMISPRANIEHAKDYKRVWLIEEMPIAEFKKSVSVWIPRTQTLSTLTGYLASDKVFFPAGHEKEGIIKDAKNYLQPSLVQELVKKIDVVAPNSLKDFRTKEESDLWRARGRRFCLGFVGRMGAFGSSMKDVYEVMTKQWIMGGREGMRVVISSVSSGGRAMNDLPDTIEFMRAPREEFWRMLREEIDVILCMAIDAGFQLSLMEPLMFGVPVVLRKAPWSIGQVGPHYPFLIENASQAYAMIEMIHDDYPTQYQKFVKWQREWLIPLFAQGGLYSRSLYTAMAEALTEAEGSATRFKYTPGVVAPGSVAEVAVRRGGDEFNLLEVLSTPEATKELKTIPRHLDEDVRDKRGIAFGYNWQETRMVLKAHFGYVDASTTVGHFKRA